MAADDDPRPARRAHPGEAHLIEERVASEQVFRGRLLDVRRDRVLTPDGHEATREYIVHPGAVLVVPRLTDGRIVVERQFRYPNNAVFLELPAGKREAGEAPLETARRELREEAGYTAARWTHLGTMHPIVSYTTEVIDAYLAEDLTHVGPAPDHGEVIDILAMPYEELLAAADRGEVTDMKTLATLYFLERRTHRDGRIARRLVIAGRVQGVGFRDAMRDVATHCGVSGWVRNRRDGGVEAWVQGPPAGVEHVLAWSRRGPPAARVTSVDIEEVPVDAALTAFDRRPTA
jgi:ADP-ribose pyrophosphatase